MKLIESIEPICPFDYGDTVYWTGDGGTAMLGSVVGFEPGLLGAADTASAFVELPSGETVKILCSKLRA